MCLSVTRQGALHVLKGIPQLVIPSSQGWGVRSFHLDSTRFFFFFFFGAFLFVIVLFLYELNPGDGAPCSVPVLSLLLLLLFD